MMAFSGVFPSRNTLDNRLTFWINNGRKCWLGNTQKAIDNDLNNHDYITIIFDKYYVIQTYKHYFIELINCL